MTWVPERLKEIAKQVHEGERPRISVRGLLFVFRAQRRGRFIASLVREAFNELRIRTVPDFNYTYLDGVITFEPISVVPQNLPTPPQERVDSEISSKPDVTEQQKCHYYVMQVLHVTHAPGCL